MVTVRVPISIGSGGDTAEGLIARITIDTAVIIRIVRKLHASFARDAVGAFSDGRRSGSTGKLLELTGHGCGARRTGVEPVLPGWNGIWWVRFVDKGLI